MVPIKEIVTDIDNVSVSKSYILDKPEDCGKYLSQLYSTWILVIAINIRSINKNYDDFMVLLSRIKHTMDLIVFTECWISDNYVPNQLVGYNVHCTKNNINQNDGVVVYYRNNLANVSCHEPKTNDSNCVIIKLGQQLAVIAIYRPPSLLNVISFIEFLDSILLSLKAYPNIILTGDINIDITDGNTDRRSDEYLTLLASHGLLPGHKIATRNKTCLDHCMIKTKTPAINLILPATITDHSPVVAHLNIKRKPKNTSTRTYSYINYDGVCKDLSQIVWSNVLDLTDVEKATEIFMSIIQLIIQKHTVVKKIPRSRANIKPWITAGLIKCMKKRDRLHLKNKKNPDNTDIKNTYIKYRNTCNKILKKLKRAYERSEINKCSNDSKKTWETIKRICNFPTKVNHAENLLKLQTDYTDSLNMVNDYFVNVGYELANKTLTALKQTEAELALKNKNNSALASFGLLNVDQSEICAIVRNLRNNSAPGWDKASGKLFKIIYPYIAEPLTIICQASFENGIFPKQLKKSIICPIHKGGDENSITNYRPISLLPTLSKILEKLMNNRLKKYLETKQLLSINQFGFRDRRNTEDAVLEVTEHIRLNLDKGKKTVGVFLDLAKAFDTVSIPILLVKLEAVGVRGVALHWFKSYLTDRKQRIKVGEFLSDDAEIQFGVPQGSILGPTLFLVYINDLCNLDLENGKVVTYADDTVLLFTAKSWNEAELTTNKGLNTVSWWLRQNLLSINVAKTKYVTFTITNSTQPKQPLQLKMHAATCTEADNCVCANLCSTSTIKYLGVLLDRHLSWQEHTKNLSGRTRKLIYIFKQLRHVLNVKTLRMVYVALAQSILSYCITVWGSASQTHLIALERSQRALLKVMSFKPRRFPTHELYKISSVLTVRQLFVKATVMRQHALLDADIINDRSKKRRKDNVFKTISARTKIGAKSFKCIGPTLYNRISRFTTMATKNRYKCNRALKDYLLTLNYKETELLMATTK